MVNVTFTFHTYNPFGTSIKATQLANRSFPFHKQFPADGRGWPKYLAKLKRINAILLIPVRLQPIVLIFDTVNCLVHEYVHNHVHKLSAKKVLRVSAINTIHSIYGHASVNDGDTF